MSRSPHPGEEHPPVPPDTPIYDAFAYLAYLAARTDRIRLGTHVFNIGLRHPFTTARGVADRRPPLGRALRVRDRRRRGSRRSGARPDSTSRRAAGASTRRSRCASASGRRRPSRTTASSSPSTKWCSSRSPCSARDRRFSSAASRRRRCAGRPGSATAGSAWGTPSSRPPRRSTRSASLLAEHDRPAAGSEPAFEIVIGGAVEARADVARWEDLGVTRMIVSPWRRSSEAIDGLRRFADRAFALATRRRARRRARARRRR